MDMLYGKIEGVDKPVSRIVFGTATKTMFDAFRSVYGAEKDFDARLARAFALLDEVYALGVNCFDCADHYGEEPLGEWMEARGLRDKIVVLTKGAHHNFWRKRVTDYDILSDAHNSLKRLRTRTIDLYLLHRDDPAVPVGPIVEVLNRLLAEKKIRAFGASNWTVARMEEAREYAARHNLASFTVASPNYGLAEQVRDPWGGGCVSLAGGEHAADRAWYQKNRIPVFAYSALARGFFSGKLKSGEPEKAKELLDEAALLGYACPENFLRLRRAEELAGELGLRVSEVALAYLFSQPLDCYALLGSNSAGHIRADMRALHTRLTEAQCRHLDLSDGE